MKKLSMLVCVLLSFFLVFPPVVMAEIVGSVTFLEGRVDKLNEAGDAYVPITAGEKVSPGDVIRTKSYSKAEVTFDDDSVVRIGDSSQIRVKDYTLDEYGYRKTGVIDLQRGSIRAIVSETFDKAPFDIITPNAVGAVTGSDIFVSFQHSATNALVSEGLFSVTNPAFPDETIEVREGMTSVVPYNAAPEEPRAFLPMEKDRYADMTGPIIKGVPAKDSRVTRAVVGRITGVVRVQPGGSTRWHAPVKNEVLKTGDRIETGETGRILINLDNGLSMDLLPNTQLIITELKRDPGTGDYENTFESNYGRIISRLENKPEKSKFAVKTPHAVCGIRGTIMYLFIDEMCSRLFFEGGNGHMALPGEGNLRNIRPGWTGKICEGAGYSESPTTDEERSRFNSQWGNEGQDEYGYTGPVGSPGYALAPLGAVGVGGEEGPAAPENPFEEKKLKPRLDTGAPTTITSEFSGWFAQCDANFGLLLDRDSEISGIFTVGASAAPWTNGPYSGTVEGRFNNPNDRCLFRTLFEASASDGGRVFGYMVGSGADTNTWQSVVSALYIDPLQSAGVMDGMMEGTHYPGISGNIGGNGYVSYTRMTDGTATPAADLWGAWVIWTGGMDKQMGVLAQACVPVGTHCLSLLNIVNEPWGVWSGCFRGAYNDVADLSLMSGNMTATGTIFGKGDYMGVLRGIDWTSEFIEGDFNALWVSDADDRWGILADHFVGCNEYTGDMGDYDGTWETIGAGDWVEVTDLLDLDLEMIHIVDRMTDTIAAFNEVVTPVTAGLTGTAFSPGFQSAAMNISLYDVCGTQIWAALVNGTYDTGNMPAAGWNIAFDGGNVNLTNGQWIGGEWFADVNGTVGANNITGTAAGTYGEGAFEGAGAGTWTTP